MASNVNANIAHANANAIENAAMTRGRAESYRRRAGSNYFELDADRRRNRSDRRSERLSSRLSNLDVGDAGNVGRGNNNSSVYNQDDDEISIDFCCEFLQTKFGFQEGSVSNQREHVLLLLANGKARLNPNDRADAHIMNLHHKLFGNYFNWCEFLNLDKMSFTGPLGPITYANGNGRGTLRHKFHMDIMLYFLVWGEAANVRHLPECICYLYHQMMQMVNSDIQCQNRQPVGWFLTQVIRPIWVECSNMKRRNALNKPLQHVKVRNYDDINEFFWKPHCVLIGVDKVGKELSTHHGKTFYEHRSIFTLILNYYRIFQFNLMFLVILSVLAYAVAISPDGGQSNFFKQFRSIGTVVEPFSTRNLKLSVVFIVFSHAILNFFKCVLEIGQNWHLFISRESSSTSSRSWSYGSALFIRFCWNGLFAGLFGYMIFLPLKTREDTSLLDNFYLVAAGYLIPTLLILLVTAFAPQLIFGTFAAKFVREGESCYVGRNMAPPFGYIIRYVMYWVLLWFFKAIVSYVVYIRPLMLPSLAIYDMKMDYHHSVVSFHNLGVIAALWLPIVFIFNYDTQIYFTIFQALLGAFQGWRMKTGEARGEKEITKAFRVAPQLFDQKVVTSLARSADGSSEDPINGRSSTIAAAYESQMMLRFVVVWNEIVNSFREGDLLDDKEAAILQYDIRSNGEVFEPVFLSAGKLADAINLSLKIIKENKGESQLRVSLVEGDCLSAIRSFFTACTYVMEALFGNDDSEVLDGLRIIENLASNGTFMRCFNIRDLPQLRVATVDLLEEILDLPDPDTQSQHLPSTNVHTMGTIRNFVTKMEGFLNCLQTFCIAPELQNKFVNTRFCSSANGYVYASRGLVNLYRSDMAMGAATRATLLLSLEKSDAMPRCTEAQRRLGFFMKSLGMDIPQLRAIKEMRSFSVVTPFYAETVLFSLKELNDPLVNHPIFEKVAEKGKNLTILKYLNKIHPEEWENFLERVDVVSAEEAQQKYPQEIRLWASYRGQTLARTVQGMMLYEDAIKILHWLEIGSSPGKSAEQKQMQLEDMVRLKFSYICACQVYGKHRKEGKEQADDIDYLLQTYPNLRVAYVDTVQAGNEQQFDSVLIKSENEEIVEVYRYQLPGDPILGEGKPENQNNAIQFTRGEFVQTIDMNQQHYFEECLKMPQLLRTADLHPSRKPVSIIGMREHIFTGNASSLAKFKTWQELVFVTLSQRVMADPLCCRMHYGHPDVFDKVLAITRGGVSKASKGINLSEDVFAGFNSTLRGGLVTHVEFMQCGKGRDVALSQISMFEGKLANGAGETSLCREAHRMGQFLDFFRLNSMYYSHTGFYFATWMTIVTTFVYIYSKVYIALGGVQTQIVLRMNTTDLISKNSIYGFDSHVYNDLQAVVNTQYYIQAGLFLSLPLMAVYFGEAGLYRGFVQFIEMVITGGPFFFIFQVGTTMHYFDNNLVHGEAQYKATGRGFKITRETFVLLYKAYASSHFRKAFELIGLCLIYRAYGSFNICEKKPTIDEGTFGQDYCKTAQGFGVQTFALWVISLVWLLSPYMFNTDGLDWEKTKQDIKAWAKWMYADEKYVDKDNDANMNGGWISWWRSELSMFHNSQPIARFTIILRESRHFIVMWYVITLRWKIIYVPIVFGAAVATVFLLGFLGMTGSNAFAKSNPLVRAGSYLFWLVVLSVGFLVGMQYVHASYSFSDVLALFFGYIGALYGINEMARMWSFANSSITNVGMFRELAFLFDFVFSVSMIIPLFVMSGVPFLNIIQTRMMYNKGFSRVVSASSQYAFSLAAFMGVLGGGGCGWLFYLLTNLELSAGFLSYVSTFKLLEGKLGNGTVSYVLCAGGAAGALIGGLLNRFIGRRLSIVMGGLLSILGMVALSAIQSIDSSNAKDGTLLTGIGLLGGSIGVLLPSLALYIFEISTRDMRSKAMLLLGLGYILGMLGGSWFSSPEHEIGWIWQVFITTVIFSIITPMVFVFPESPIWTYATEGLESCERCLTVLRRKEGVRDELKAIREEESADESGGSAMFKFTLGLFLMLISALSQGCLEIYLARSYTKIIGDQSLMFVNCICMELLGSLLSFFFIDRVDHRRVLLFTLIPVAICSAVLAFDAQSPSTWTGTSKSVMLQIVGLLMYFFLGLGTASVLWAACVGLFSFRLRSVYTTLYFMLFYVIPIVALYIRTKDNSTSTSKNTSGKEYAYLYALTGCCVVVLVLLMGAGSKSNGILCTKQEMEADKARIRRMRSSRRSARTPGSARSHNLSRSRSKSHSRSNYQLLESPAAGHHPA